MSNGLPSVTLHGAAITLRASRKFAPDLHWCNSGAKWCLSEKDRVKRYVLLTSLIRECGLLEHRTGFV